MTAKRVTVISQFFYPNLVSTGLTVTELAVGMAKEGYAVEVYTGPPTLPKAVSKKDRTYPLCGVRVHTLFSTRFSHISFLGKLINQLSFSLSLGWVLWKLPKGEVVLFFTNPPYLMWMVAWVQKIKAFRAILVLFDVYPDSAVACGYLAPQGVLTRIWRRLNQWAYPRMERLVVLGRCMETHFKQVLSPMLHERIVRIPVWVDDVHIRNQVESGGTFKKEWGLEGKTVVMYSGNLARFHDLTTIILAAEKLKEVPDLVFLFVGEGYQKPKLQAMVEEKKLTQCVFKPFVDHEHLGRSLNTADISLVSLLPEQVGYSVPSKTYGLLAAGSCIVAMMPETAEIAQMLIEENAGVVIPPQSPDRLAETILFLKNNPEQRQAYKHAACASSKKTYALQKTVRRYVALIEKSLK